MSQGREHARNMDSKLLKCTQGFHRAFFSGFKDAFEECSGVSPKARGRMCPKVQS